PEQHLERGVAPVAREQRAAEAEKRRPLLLRPVRPAGDERFRERDVLQARPALEDERAGDVVELEDLARVLAGLRIDGRVAGAELVLLHREAEPVSERLLRHLLGPGAVPLEAAD